MSCVTHVYIEENAGPFTEASFFAKVKSGALVWSILSNYYIGKIILPVPVFNEIAVALTTSLQFIFYFNFYDFNILN